jgi:hypothetical protein
MSDLFTSADDQGALFEDETNPVIDPTKNYLEEYVGEGKKFKDAAALAKAKAEADAFIERLKNENKGLRGQLNQQVTLEAVLDKLNKAKNTDGEPPPNNQSGDNKPKEVTEDDIEKLLDRRLTERERQTLAKSNETEATDALVAKFGSLEQAKAQIRQKAAELELKPEELRAMAQTRPKAFLTLMGVGQTQRQSHNPPPRSTVNSVTEGFNPTGERTKKYYDNLKKTDPKLYWTPKVQNEIHAQALRLRERFFD